MMSLNPFWDYECAHNAAAAVFYARCWKDFGFNRISAFCVLTARCVIYMKAPAVSAIQTNYHYAAYT